MNLTERPGSIRKKIAIFDGSGSSPLATSAIMRAFIHRAKFRSWSTDGSVPQIRDMLAANPPSVVILKLSHRLAASG